MKRAELATTSRRFASITYERIEIDGSLGEGGGQVLRTSLALSLASQKGFRMHSIRAGRSKPGLLNQHLTAVLAAAKVGKAEVTGAELGSKVLCFTPTKLAPGDYHFSIETAGSACLVLQTILPALLLVNSPSTFILEGGTHNSASPPFDFLTKTYFPILRQMGQRVDASLSHYGFYPAGGGRFAVNLQPSKLKAIGLRERGKIFDQSITALFSQMPAEKVQNEIQGAGAQLGVKPANLHVKEVRSRGPGLVIFAEFVCEHVTEVFTAFGEKKHKPNDTATLLAAEAKAWLDTGVPVDQHLCNQLMLLCALAGAGTFRTMPLDGHGLTQLDTIRKFYDVTIDVQKISDQVVELSFHSS